ncbi:uncharacterized protein si:ch211-133n4.6 isoform X1 [Girardinichthys multiradiatus]|uniref:uncharacterized protein si:ch211-133n4.6 isoform X1 n=1 Tax=Girardinichthys multiradiatus TaxID=208333 RepID=UPI001FAD3B7D|nr:uncharacterized protein si:ch211-133n4.6 isoform X1 [Girardinichthys multiradiatus]
MMLTRKVILLFSLFVLLVKGDFDTSDVGSQAISTDKDSLSDEAPTESMNIVSPDQTDESQYYAGGPSDPRITSSETADTPAGEQVAAPEPAAAALSSAEEEDEDEGNDSEEGAKKKFNSRSAKPPSSAHANQSPAHIVQVPALLPQPVAPQPKTLPKTRSSKRRSRTNHRQI